LHDEALFSRSLFCDFLPLALVFTKTWGTSVQVCICKYIEGLPRRFQQEPLRIVRQRSSRHWLTCERICFWPFSEGENGEHSADPTLKQAVKQAPAYDICPIWPVGAMSEIRGKSYNSRAMVNLKQLVAELQKQRQQLDSELTRLDKAIGTLSGIAGNKRSRTRRLSPAARARIAAAQRARWAKWKRARKAA
jgi:hypothetical protein